MIHTLITTYIFIAGVIFGYNASDIHNFKSFCITFVCSLFFPIILMYYLIIALFESCKVKDIIWFLKLLLNIESEETISLLKQSKAVINGIKCSESESVLYRYLAKKVIKKYNL